MIQHIGKCWRCRNLVTFPRYIDIHGMWVYIYRHDIVLLMIILVYLTCENLMDDLSGKSDHWSRIRQWMTVSFCNHVHSVQFLNLPEPSHTFYLLKNHNVASELWTCTRGVFCDVDKLLRCFSSWVFLPLRHHVALPCGADPTAIQKGGVIWFCKFAKWEMLLKGLEVFAKWHKKVGNSSKTKWKQHFSSNRKQSSRGVWWIFRFLSSEVWIILIDIDARSSCQTLGFCGWAVSASGIVTGSNQP